MLIGYKVFSHLLNNYPTKAMADENQWSIFRILLLPILRLMRGNFWLERVVTSLRLLSRAVSNWMAHEDRLCFGAPKSHFDS